MKTLALCTLHSALCILSVLLLGCAHRNARTAPGPRATADPLIGGSVLGTPKPVSATSPAAPATTVPPVPVSSAPLSNAVLAGGGLPKPLAGGHPLGIADSPGSQGAVLGTPEPMTAVPVSRQPPPAAAPRVTSLEQGQALLEARGVQWQRLDMVHSTGEWTFRCGIASPQNPNVSRTYEGRARTGLAALQAVLDQIDQETREQGTEKN